MTLVEMPVATLITLLLEMSRLEQGQWRMICTTEDTKDTKLGLCALCVLCGPLIGQHQSCSIGSTSKEPK